MEEILECINENQRNNSDIEFEEGHLDCNSADLEKLLLENEDDILEITIFGEREFSGEIETGEFEIVIEKGKLKEFDALKKYANK